MRTDLDKRVARIRRKTAPGWLRPILEVPLEVKLLGANLIIVGVALLLLFGPVGLPGARLADAYVVVAALTLGATVNFVLVMLALSPIKAIERVATRISQGMLGERVPASIVADRHLARLSTTINEMLHGLAVGRERVQELSVEVARAEARERAQVARELQDAVGRTLLTASHHIAAAAAELGTSARSSRLADAGELLRNAIEVLANIAPLSRPRVMTDLALPNPLAARPETSRQGSRADTRPTATLPRIVIPDRRAAVTRRDISVDDSRSSGTNGR
jgi:signal transduction histidine kinase